ncbi:MAG: DUF1036 domain-containing protein [Rhodobacteraceae bacterium]|nr:DUF1036 domain-containing protein [Paracoccaceae bacterium]
MRAFLLVAAATFAMTNAAQAGLEICNNTDQVQSVAIGYKGDTDWMSEGWWNIDPGECAVLVSGNLSKRYYYYHADSRDGGFRGQNFGFCTHDDAFEIVGDTDCGKRGYDEADFREIDTGETATSFTLTLVDSGSSPAGGAKGPGGGGDGEVATQSVTETPVETDVTVDDTALETGMPPGRHGEPFELAALFQGCELEDGRAYCGFHSDGVKLRAYYRGPTPKDLLYALEMMPMNAPVTVTGDRLDGDRMHAAVVLRGVDPRAGGDAYTDLRETLQGDWVLSSDRESEITIRGSEIHVRYEGVFRLTRFLKLADRCEGLRGAGPVLIQTSLRDRRPKCYGVARADTRTLELVPVKGGDTLRFQRQN